MNPKTRFNLFYVLVAAMGVTVTLLVAGTDGAALTVAAAGLPLSAVVAWRTLPVAQRNLAWTSMYGIAAATGSQRAAMLSVLAFFLAGALAASGAPEHRVAKEPPGHGPA